jgi:hypothetical protein
MANHFVLDNFSKFIDVYSLDPLKEEDYAVLQYDLNNPAKYVKIQANETTFYYYEIEDITSAYNGFKGEGLSYDDIAREITDIANAIQNTLREPETASRPVSSQLTKQQMEDAFNPYFARLLETGDNWERNFVPIFKNALYKPWNRLSGTELHNDPKLIADFNALYASPYGRGIHIMLVCVKGVNIREINKVFSRIVNIVSTADQNKLVTGEFKDTEDNSTKRLVDLRDVIYQILTGMSSNGALDDIDAKFSGLSRAIDDFDGIIKLACDRNGILDSEYFTAYKSASCTGSRTARLERYVSLTNFNIDADISGYDGSLFDLVKSFIIWCLNNKTVYFESITTSTVVIKDSADHYMIGGNRFLIKLPPINNKSKYDYNKNRYTFLKKIIANRK